MHTHIHIHRAWHKEWPKQAMPYTYITQENGVWTYMNTLSYSQLFLCVCAHMCTCVHACECVCMCVCDAHVYAGAWAHEPRKARGRHGVSCSIILVFSLETGSWTWTWGSVGSLQAPVILPLFWSELGSQGQPRMLRIWTQGLMLRQQVFFLSCFFFSVVCFWDSLSLST